VSAGSSSSPLAPGTADSEAALCFLLLFFFGDFDGQGEEYATRVARGAFAALPASPGALEPAVPELGSDDVELSLGDGDGDADVGVGELGVGGGAEWVGSDVDGGGEVIPETGLDEAQLLGLLDAGLVAPVPELLPTA
jgi:hypothetical protein